MYYIGVYFIIRSFTIVTMKLKRYIISFSHMAMLLRGEHHYKMVLGLPDDAEIISFKPHKDGLKCFDVLVKSEEFHEFNNMDECEDYGSFVLEGMPCMPISGEVINKK